MKPPSVLLLSKKRDDPFAEEALRFVSRHFPTADIVLGKPGETLPKETLRWTGDYIVSYLCGWVVPQCLLDRAKVAAINFHPGPPEYPGTGCYNFALYEGATKYGVTCHHMAASVDAGDIIAVRRFPLFPADNVLSLAKRSSACLLELFYEIMPAILDGRPMPESDEVWQRKPFTRRDMHDLFRISPDMPKDEVLRRIAAAEHPDWPGAFVEVSGERFYHKPCPPGQG